MQARYLITLLFIIALNAAGGAWYGLSGAPGVPRSWLSGSPFTTYFIPSLILGVAVGGSALIAGLAVWRRWRRARLLSYAAGAALAVWIVAQVVIIGYVSWLQPAMALAALLIILLTAKWNNDAA